MTKPARLALLVADNDARVRRAVSASGLAMHFNVSCARDSKEAIDLLITRQFDAVLTDFNIQGMNGRKFLAWIRKYRPDVPVCIMTAEAADAAFRAEIEPLIDGLLAKPFSAAELESWIRKATLCPKNHGKKTAGRKAKSKAGLLQTSGATPSSAIRT